MDEQIADSFIMLIPVESGVPNTIVSCNFDMDIVIPNVFSGGGEVSSLFFF
jgi:hypothetical protein